MYPVEQVDTELVDLMVGGVGEQERKEVQGTALGCKNPKCKGTIPDSVGRGN